ncbi:MAG: cell division protein FtsQ/DivIB [Alphaproteobacteria bacterium]|nr:cell division protein FtsQ/DivIB [Alphaproteobacteria bacterium]
MRREPEFEYDRPRRRGRDVVMDEYARPAVVVRKSASRGKKRAPEPVEADWSWLPAIGWRSPALMVTGAFLLLAALAGLVEGGHLSFGGDEPSELASAGRGSPGAAWFPIDDIVAQGQYHTRESDLRAAIGLKQGDDMLDVEPDAIRAKVEALDWIATARVARLWPATLEIKVTEKEPYAIWQSKGVLWLIDRKGNRITKDDVAEFAGLPMVVGDGAPEHAVELLDILKRFPAIQRATKASVRVGDRRWDLHLKNGITVRLPEDGIEDALHRLTVLQQEQRIFERDIETIDLRLPDRLVIKTRGGGASESIQKGEST